MNTANPPANPPTKIANAKIKADVNNPNPSSIYSKYLLEMKYKTPDGDLLALVLNINADVAVTSFYSKGSEKGDMTLIVKYRTTADDLTGFARFKGTIGAGRIAMNLDNGVTITGKIIGGPTVSQGFVGTGTWTMS